MRYPPSVSEEPNPSGKKSNGRTDGGGGGAYTVENRNHARPTEKERGGGQSSGSDIFIISSPPPSSRFRAARTIPRLPYRLPNNYQLPTHQLPTTYPQTPHTSRSSSRSGPKTDHSYMHRGRRGYVSPERGVYCVVIVFSAGTADGSSRPDHHLRERERRFLPCAHDNNGARCAVRARSFGSRPVATPRAAGRRALVPRRSADAVSVLFFFFPRIGIVCARRVNPRHRVGSLSVRPVTPLFA